MVQTVSVQFFTSCPKQSARYKRVTAATKLCGLRPFSWNRISCTIASEIYVVLGVNLVDFLHTIADWQKSNRLPIFDNCIIPYVFWNTPFLCCECDWHPPILARTSFKRQFALRYWKWGPVKRDRSNWQVYHIGEKTIIDFPVGKMALFDAFSALILLRLALSFPA